MAGVHVFLSSVKNTVYRIPSPKVTLKTASEGMINNFIVKHSWGNSKKTTAIYLRCFHSPRKPPGYNPKFWTLRYLFTDHGQGVSYQPPSKSKRV